MKSTCVPPSSRREANREARRDAILDVASRWFLEHGYAATTMSAIAAELGGSKGTLWNYFPSKEELFAAVIVRVAESFRAQLVEILNPAQDVAETLRRYARKFLTKVTSPEGVALHRVVLGESSRFPEVGRIFYEQAPLATKKLLADYLAGAMANGQLRQDDAFDAAQNFSGLLMTGCHQRLLTNVIDEATPALIEADVERAVPAFMRAYDPSYPRADTA